MSRAAPTRAASTTGVRLRPFAPADFSRLIGWLSATPGEEELLRWAGPIFTWPLDPAQLERYLDATRETPPARLVWRADAETGAPFGHVELSAIDRRQRSATLSRVLVDPARRGEGLAASMVTAALAVAFDELRLHRVQLSVFDFNIPALRCYDRLGFVREGVLRDARRLRGGTYWNVVCCSLLEDEWRRRRIREEDS